MKCPWNHNLNVSLNFCRPRILKQTVKGEKVSRNINMCAYFLFPFLFHDEENLIIDFVSILCLFLLPF